MPTIDTLEANAWDFTFDDISTVRTAFKAICSNNWVSVTKGITTVPTHTDTPPSRDILVDLEKSTKLTSEERRNFPTLHIEAGHRLTLGSIRFSWGSYTTESTPFDKLVELWRAFGTKTPVE